MDDDVEGDHCGHPHQDHDHHYHHHPPHHLLLFLLLRKHHHYHHQHHHPHHHHHHHHHSLTVTDITAITNIITIIIMTLESKDSLIQIYIALGLLCYPRTLFLEPVPLHLRSICCLQLGQLHRT